MTTKLALAFAPLGWQEILILACPAITVGVIILVLFLTGVIGGKKK